MLKVDPILLAEARATTVLTQGLVLALIALASAATLTTALLFQYVGGLRPCELCHDQRFAHAAALALALAGAFLPWGRGMGTDWRPVFLAGAAAALLAGALYAGIHVGVEEHLWNPLGCATSGTGPITASDLASAFTKFGKAVPCDEKAWTLFGISMAGYNLAITLTLGVFALVGLGRPVER
ncbi:MAG: disulfide bond formation protein B [Alphaproteobacteria bacterium]|nr:disulfide bond formation protein B [Alphaproteobacteria bacterium]